jgi:hypothetical protein
MDGEYARLAIDPAEVDASDPSLGQSSYHRLRISVGFGSTAPF